MALKEYANKYQELGWKAVHAEVKYARIQKNFKAELKRLEMNIVDESQSDEVWQIIKEDLKRDKEVQWYHRKPVKLDCGCLYRLRSGRRAMCWRCMGYPYVAFSCYGRWAVLAL